MRIDLTPAEALQAATVASMIQVQNYRHAAKARYGAPTRLDAAWGAAIVGAFGEAAVAKATGRWWSGNIGNRTAKDAGGYQVRSTVHERGRLIVHPTDADDDVFVLAYVQDLRVFLNGWTTGSDAKVAEHWHDPGTGRPAFFVPTGNLRNMRDLPDVGRSAT